MLFVRILRQIHKPQSFRRRFKRWFERLKRRWLMIYRTLYYSRLEGRRLLIFRTLYDCWLSGACALSSENETRLKILEDQ